MLQTITSRLKQTTAKFSKRFVSGVLTAVLALSPIATPLLATVKASAAETGFKSPTQTTSPNNWSNADGAYSESAGEASANQDGKEQAYRNFHLTDGNAIPNGSIIKGIEVKLRSKQEGEACRLEVRLSWNGGSSYTNAKYIVPSDDGYTNQTLGSPTDTWGKNDWTVGHFSNGSSSFRVKVTYKDPGNDCDTSGDSRDDIKLDHLQVKVYFDEPVPTDGKIKVKKYEDKNGNSQRDSGEDFLEDWDINLYNSNWTKVDDLETEDDEWRSFDGLTYGTYYVCEEDENGWAQTDPTVNEGVQNGSNNNEEAARCWQVTLTSQNKTAEVYFGNQKVGKVKVHKHVDLNGDGDFKDANETSNSTANNMGFRWGIDAEATDNQFGTSQTNVPAGTHTVKENLDAVVGYEFVGWYYTEDEDNSGERQLNCKYLPGYSTNTLPVTVTVEKGKTLEITLCNKKIPQGALKVVKKLKNDNGGQKQYGAFTFKIDENDAARSFDNAETPDTGYSSQGYTTINLDAGSTFNVKEVEEDKDGYKTTYLGDCDSAVSGAIESGKTKTCVIVNDDIAPVLNLTKVVVNNWGGTADEDDWFLKAFGPTSIFGWGNATSGSDFQAGDYSLSEWGYKSNYVAGDWKCDVDGVQQTGSLLSIMLGQTVNCTIKNYDTPAKLTIIKDSHPNSIQTFDFTLKQKGQYGWYHKDSFKLNDNGTSYPVDNDKTFYLKAGTYSVTEHDENGWYLDDLYCWGTWNWNKDKRDQRVTVTLKMGDEVTCKFINNKYAKVTGFKFEDKNKNGWWNFGEKGLEGWEITLNKKGDKKPAVSTYTNKFGAYSFDNLKPGKYEVCEVQQDGWVQTAPASGCKELWVKAGDHEFVKFGNFQYGTVSGIKFNDVNGSGTYDQGDLTLSGWTIQLKQGDTVIDTAVTDENGAFVFGGLDYNETYTICEVQQAKWSQTYPTKDGKEACHEVTVTKSGEVFENKDFGNKPIPQVLGEDDPAELVKTGASAAISTAFGLVILSVLGTLHFLTRRKNYQN